MSDSHDPSLPISEWLSSLRIRLAVKKDLRAMEWEGAYQRFRGVYADVFARTRRGMALMWVVEQPGGRLLGQAFVQLNMSDHTCANGKERAYLHSFRVRPEFQGRGLGSAIMNHIEKDLISRGFRELTLNVAEENEGALRLYRRLGYQILKKIPGKWSYFDDQGKLQTVIEPGYRLIKMLKEPSSQSSAVS